MTVFADKSLFNPALMQKFEAARLAAKHLATATTGTKNSALAAIAEALLHNSDKIIEANQLDLQRAKTNELAQNLSDRLCLSPDRIRSLAASVSQIEALADPVGKVIQGSTLPNGLLLSQVRVPFGVVGAIYEARPNVTVDIAALALKSGNAVLLRGGSAAEQTNKLLVELIQTALAEVGISRYSVQTIDEFGRKGATEMMRARGWVDLLIPRGSANLISSVVTQSTVPVIETGDGIVHIFVDESADLDNAVDIVLNAKTQRPSVCNAMETLLVHESIAAKFLPRVLSKLLDAGVEIFGDTATTNIFAKAKPATEENYNTEYLALAMSVKIVSSLAAAISHIDSHSTRHTESILTENIANAEEFLRQIDSAVVMVNASTRFTDGGEFGFGAEVGISTQKLHARGPMGLPELTSTKWLVRGAGQIRA